jgi:thiol-disulfide isomerase/thioredoxin
MTTTARIVFAALCAMLLSSITHAQAVEETLDAWHQAAAESRFDDYFALLTEDAIFVGTDATEHWNVEQFKDYAREPFANDKGWVMESSDRRIRMSDDNQTAWIVERLHHAGMGELRGSGALVDTDAGWKISQYVLSIPVPNEVAYDVIEKIDEHAQFGTILGTWRAAVLCDGGEIEFELHIFMSHLGLQTTIITPRDHNSSGASYIESVEFSESRLTLSVEEFDSKIEASVDPVSGKLVGTWTKVRGKDNTAVLDFVADRDVVMSYNAGYIKEGPFKVAKRYRVQFDSSPDPAVLEFVSSVGPAFATIRTTTGDYGYLYGFFDGAQLTLSTFDGAHAFLFKATAQADGSFLGDFWSGDWWHETWTATPDENATLADPWKQTTWNPATKLADLKYPNLDGNMRALNDPEFAGRCKIIEVFGTWCPNCMDATKELKRLRNKFGHKGLSVLALAFEVTGDPVRDTKQVQRYLELTKINYPVLLAGSSDKAESSKAFPAVDKIRSYPTFIFLDARDRVRGIYTGFSGPATGEHYKNQQRQFEQLIETILAES